MAEYHIQAGKYLAQYAEKWGISLGYENYDDRIIDKIGRKRFGYLFDIGHTALSHPAIPHRDPSKDITAHTLQMIDERIDKTVEFHVHGVIRTEKEHDHQPLDKDNIIDYKQVIALLKGRDYKGPLVFEILRQKNQWMNIAETIEACRKAKQRLIEYEKSV